VIGYENSAALSCSGKWLNAGLARRFDVGSMCTGSNSSPDQGSIRPPARADRAAGCACRQTGELLAHDCYHHPLSVLRDNFLGVDELLAAGSQALELFGFG
jgi:hypothetical protein